MADQPSVIELEDCPSTEDEAPTKDQNEPANGGRTYQKEHELREQELWHWIIEGLVTALLNSLVVGAILFLCLKKGYTGAGAGLAFAGFLLCLAHFCCVL
jgi:hypothetical protein